MPKPRADRHQPDRAAAATTTTIDLAPEVCAAGVEVPIVAVVLEQFEAVQLLPGSGENSSAVPAYAYPESAARALGHAVRYGTRRAAPPEPAPVSTACAKTAARSSRLQHDHGDAIFVLLDQDALEAEDALVPVTAAAQVAGWQAHMVKPQICAIPDHRVRYRCRRHRRPGNSGRRLADRVAACRS